MLSIEYIRNHAETVQQACVQKHIPVDIDELLDCDRRLRSLRQRRESLQAQRNTLSRQVRDVDEAQRDQLVSQVKEMKRELEQLVDTEHRLASQFNHLMLKVSQPAREDVPVGKDDSENRVIRVVGKPAKRLYPIKDHMQLVLDHHLADFQRAVKISGSRSYVLTGKGALLEQAILRMVYDDLVSYGYTPMSVPVLVRESAMQGTGHFPLGRDQSYLCEKDNFALVGTSEVSLCAFYSEDLLDEKDLPKKCLAQTSCFRREAGSYGRDTKGFYRVHQFQKIEQVIIAPHDDEVCAQYHHELLQNAEKIMQKLELPYQVVMVCTGDLGQGQYYKHDIETWMPSRNSYGETHSCSSFREFQARRLNLRYRDQDGKKHYCYTLNNTAIASPRILIPFLENHQTAEGDIYIPKDLRVYLNGREYLSEL